MTLTSVQRRDHVLRNDNNMEIRKEIQRMRGPYRQSYNLEDMEKAFYKVLCENVPIQRAARLLKVPETTLRDRVKGRINLDTLTSGPSTLFKQEEEDFLARHVTLMDEIGCGYTRVETLNLASDYAVNLGYRDKQQRLSHFWLYRFIDRHPRLKEQKPRISEIAVKDNLATNEAISSYYRELNEIMDKYEIRNSPQSIYYVDEQRLSTDVSAGDGGEDCKYRAASTGKPRSVTMMSAVNAAGASIPPFLVFPGKRFRTDLLQGATPGVQGKVTETGCSNTDIFSDYVRNHFLRSVPECTAASPVLVLYDGHTSHVSLSLMEWAKENHMVLFIRPPHCNLLQTLDVQSYWTAACHTYLQETNGKVIPHNNVCSIACRVHTSSMVPSEIISSFKKADIYPLKFVAPLTVFTKIASENTVVIPSETGPGSRGGKLLENAIAAIKARKKSKVVLGKAIMAVTEADEIQERCSEQGKKRKTDSTEIQMSDSEHAKTTTRKGKGVSRRKSERKGKRTKKKSQTAIQKKTDSDAASEDDGAKCCACERFTPVQVQDEADTSVVQWAQCDSCSHWTHLTFCTAVREVNNEDTFYCPHCTVSVTS